MKYTKTRAIKRPAKVSPQLMRRDTQAGAVQQEAGDDRAMVAYLQGTAGNQAVCRLIQRYGHQPSAWLAAYRHPVDGVQRAPAPAPAKTENRADYVDLLTGFGDLAVAAMNEGGKRLDTVHFGSDISSAHRRLLENMRTALIQAQEQSPDSKRAAIVEWPSLETKLRDAMDRARQLRVSAAVLATVDNNLAIVSEKYIHAPHRGPSRVENPDDYVDLLTGINGLLAVVEQESWDRTTGVLPLHLPESNQKQRTALAAVQFGGHLIPRHRDLLINLRRALIYARTEVPGSADAALQLWGAIQGDLRYAFKRAPEFVTNDVGGIQKELSGIGEQLIRGGAYTEKHQAALKHVDLKSPDAPFQRERLKEAAEEYDLAGKLINDAEKLSGKKLLDQVLKSQGIEGELGSAIFEIVRGKGEMLELLEAYKKKGVIGKGVTAIDMADKILGLRNAAIKVGCSVLRSYALFALEKATEPAAIERWAHVAEWAGAKLEMLEKVEKVAGVITIAVSAIKIIDALIHKDWAAAAKETITTGAGYLAGVAVKGSATATGEGGGALAMGGVAMIAGTVVVIAAEWEALSGAAAMVAYCRKANVREAAWSVVDVCVGAGGNTVTDVQHFLADVQMLADPANAPTKHLIENNLALYLPYWRRNMHELSEQFTDTRVNRIGGQPALLKALGSEAQGVLQAPDAAQTWQAMADQMRIVFAGANALAAYVAENYPRREKAAKKEEGEGEGEGGKKEGGE